jgi:hypothetical protein
MNGPAERLTNDACSDFNLRHESGHQQSNYLKLLMQECKNQPQS